MDLQFLNDNSQYIWYALGVGFIILDLIVFSGIGFFFLGFAAITVGAFITFSFLNYGSIYHEIAAFLILTVFWAIILWRPLKRFSSSSNSYSNIKGDTAIVESDFSKGDTGKVKWSGTIMNANIDDNCEKDKFNKGDKVIITDISGNTLIVSTK